MTEKKYKVKWGVLPGIAPTIITDILVDDIIETVEDDDIVELHAITFYHSEYVDSDTEHLDNGNGVYSDESHEFLANVDLELGRAYLTPGINEDGSRFYDLVVEVRVKVSGSAGEDRVTDVHIWVYRIDR